MKKYITDECINLIKTDEIGVIRSCLILFEKFAASSITIMKYNLYSDRARKDARMKCLEHLENSGDGDRYLVDLIGEICEEISYTEESGYLMTDIYADAINQNRRKFKDQNGYQSELDVSFPGNEFKYISCAETERIYDDKHFNIWDTDRQGYVLMPMISMAGDYHRTLNVYSRRFRNWIILNPQESFERTDKFKTMVVDFDKKFHFKSSSSEALDLSVKDISDHTGAGSLGNEYSALWICIFMIMFSTGVRHINDHKYLWIRSTFVTPNTDVEEAALDAIRKVAMRTIKNIKPK